MNLKKRIKIVKITPEVLPHILRTGTAWQIANGIPDGAIVKGFTLDPNTQCLNLFLEHESFDEVNVESDIAPTLEILFRKI